MRGELIHEYTKRVELNGRMFVARAYGRERADGTWTAWLEFVPVDAAGSTLATGEETSQPTRDATVYWASGIESVYLDGAIARAKIAGV